MGGVLSPDATKLGRGIQEELIKWFKKYSNLIKVSNGLRYHPTSTLAGYYKS
jgi:hypothetical protein